ncbi:MAG: DUF4350 domain-containing protein [Fuerstiella sp.]|nr:DUF4350 domain-containing protein [Fuerstiella sp.]
MTLILVTTGVCSAAELTALRLGYGGVGTTGKWLPITVEAGGLPAGEHVQLRAAFSDPRGDTCVQIVDEVEIGMDGSASLTGCFRCGRIEGLGTVSLNLTGAPDNAILRMAIAHAENVEPASSDALIHRTLKLNKAGTLTLMTVGEVAGIEEFLRNTEFYSTTQPLLQGVRVASLRQLPDIAVAYESVDYLLLTDEFAMSPAQTAAIQQWVRAGGNLFVSAGNSVTEFVTTDLGAWLSPIFGIRPEPIPTRDLTSLQGYVQGASRLEDNFRSVPMAVLQRGQTLPEVDSLSGLIIGRQSVGTGVVTFIAVDINQRPVSRWPSLPQFYETLLLGEKLTRRSAQTSRNMRISQSGVSDLSTQLMAAVDATSEEGRWSTWGVMGIIVGWLLLIGPVDYLLVTRVLKRPHVTWITFPSLILGGAAVVYSFAADNPLLQLNQWHVLDVIADGNKSYITARSWMSVSSPRTMRSDVKALPSVPGDTSSNPLARLTWAGRAEDVFGGMYRTGGISLGRQSYTHEGFDDGRLTGVPFLTNGSRSLFAEWNTQCESLIDTQLSASGFGLLTGTFSHKLPFPITDWIIVYGNRVYRTSGHTSRATRLSPGDVWDSNSPEIFPFDLKTWLTGVRSTAGGGNEPVSTRGSTQINTPYDKSSTDPHYILTMASLFDAAGGSNYTGLAQSLFRQMELSDSIRMNHAVLIGLAETPSTALAVGKQTIEPAISQTVIRLLLPVNRKPSSGLARTREELEKLKEAE